MSPRNRPGGEQAEVPMPDRAEQEAQADREVATEVLRLEARALNALAAALDASLTRAVELLLGVSGRVVVTGIGKSGHVARKFAATLASTGTPAQFVHPGEASHGDLGMITRHDAVIALSNSGKTQELSDIIHYAKRFAIPLIAVTGRRESLLAEQADVALLLADVREACPLGLAPTTSTTQMLALGDAIAVALLRRRGFTEDDFSLFHPRGALGHKLLKVRDIMHTGDGIPTARVSLAMGEVILTMTAKSLGCVGILDDDGRLVGIITDGDLRRHMQDELLRRQAREIMTPKPLTVDGNALAAEALGIMNERAVTSLFILDAGGRPAGIIHIHDCLRAGVA